jgi:hypothetical protein
LRRNCLVNHVIEAKKEERREDKEEDVSNYRMIFRKRDYTGN